MNEQSAIKPWYRKGWGVFLVFILFFPAGFYLAWKNPHWSKRRKKVVNSLASAALVILLALVVIFAPPSVDVTSALKPVRGGEYTLTGTVYPESATVTVNGEKVKVDGDQFSVDLDLDRGDNTIAIVVTDGDKKTEKTIQIHRYTKSEERKLFPKVTHKTITKKEGIGFDKKTVKSSALAKGVTRVTTAGVKGSKTLTYKITYSNGKEVRRKLIRTKVTEQPVTQVTTIGTYVAPKPAPPPAPTPAPSTTRSSCDSNYSGCVPIASDVDCAGGSGNGPAYVSGPVYVKGYDIYGLDGDGDGVGCE